jgi:hypothetical protein
MLNRPLYLSCMYSFPRVQQVSQLASTCSMFHLVVYGTPPNFSIDPLIIPTYIHDVWCVNRSSLMIATFWLPASDKGDLSSNKAGNSEGAAAPPSNGLPRGVSHKKKDLHANNTNVRDSPFGGVRRVGDGANVPPLDHVTKTAAHGTGGTLASRPSAASPTSPLHSPVHMNGTASTRKLIVGGGSSAAPRTPTPGAAAVAWSPSPPPAVHTLTMNTSVAPLVKD